MLAVRTVILALLSLTTLAAAAPSTLPATAPTTAPAPAVMTALLARLDDRDPTARDQARTDLMQLRRDDLPALAEVAQAQPALSPTQWSLLREVVIQVYLTGKHNFTGIGPGYLGITLTNQQQVEGDETKGARVHSRLVGYDGYRALQVGDVITAISREHAGADFKAVENFNQLRSLLSGTKPGEWIAIRVIRDGTEREVRLRVGQLIGAMAAEVNAANFVEGERYWSETFKRKLRNPASRPAR